jgi:serine/threonine protein kinase
VSEPRANPQLKSLGRYKIKGVLGQGAMGLVYDAVDPKLDRRVAIKTILTQKLSAEAARMAKVRFEREVRAVARLNHPNIVQVYDFGAGSSRTSSTARSASTCGASSASWRSCSRRSSSRTRPGSSTATSSPPT